MVSKEAIYFSHDDEGGGSNGDCEKKVEGGYDQIIEQMMYKLENDP